MSQSPTQAPAAGQPPQFDIKGLALGVWRRRRLALSLFIVLTAVTTLLALQMRTARYQATARLFIDQEIRGLSTGTHTPALQQINVHTLVALVKLDQNLDRVLGQQKLKMSRADLAKSINVVNPRKTKIVEIVVVHRRPSVAARIANAVADVAVAEASRQAKHQTSETYESVCRELGRIGREIGQVEQRLVRQAETDALANPKGETSALVSIRQRLDAQLVQSRIERAQAEARLKVLALRISRTPGRILDVVRDQRMLQRELIKQRMALSRLRARYTDAHPQVAALNKQVVQLKALISSGQGRSTREVSTRANPARTQMQIDYSRQLTLAAASEAKLRSLESKLKQITQRLLKLPEITLKYQEQVRRLRALTAFQIALLRRREEARLIRDSSVKPIRMVSAATIPDPRRPLSSKAKLVAVGGAFLAGLMSLALIVLLAFRDRRLTGDEDIVKTLDTRRFGQLPEIEDEKARLIANHIATSSLTEVFRNLAAEIEPKAFPCVLQVSGVSPGDGATLVVANLALALGRLRRAVTVLDLNLRSPRRHPLLPETWDGKGLATQLDSDEKVSRVAAGRGVTLIPGAGPAHDSAELMAHPALAALIAELRETQDVILLDAPSLTPYSDGRTLAAHADEVLLVATPWRTTREAAQRAREILRDDNKPLRGVVINRTAPPQEWLAAEKHADTIWRRIATKAGSWLSVIVLLVLHSAGCRPPLPAAPTHARSAATQVKLPGPWKAAAEAGSSDASLGPGDRLAVRVIGEPEASVKDVGVWYDGRVSLPLVGTVMAAGRSPAALQRLVTRRLERFIHVPQVTVVVLKVLSRRVSVLGAVSKPGSYNVRSGATLLTALAQAGGIRVERVGTTPQSTADLARAVVMRRGRVIMRDFRRLVVAPKAGDDLILRGDEIVYVPSIRHQVVYVLGEVRKPSRFIVAGRATVLQIVTRAQGFTNDADISDVRLVRGGLSQRRVFRVDVDAIVRGKAPDVPVRPGDIVYVPPSGIALFNRSTKMLFRLIGASLQATSLGLALRR